MLADVQPLTQTGVRAALEADGGFEIVGTARTGAEVLPLLRRTSPNAVLLAFGTQGVDSLSLLQRIVAESSDVAVVICSATADPIQIQSAFRRGARGYVLKSINPADLGSAIRQAVEGTAYHASGLPAIEHDTAGEAAGLTQRELDIVKGVARGLSNNQIATELSISVQTVKFHLTAIYRKLEITNRTQAASWALHTGLITDNNARRPQRHEQDALRRLAARAPHRYGEGVRLPVAGRRACERSHRR